MPRKTTSAESVRGIWTQPVCVVALSPPPLRRECQTANVATATTSGHPTPTSTRFARSCSPAPARRRWCRPRPGGTTLGGVDLTGLPAEDEVDGVLGQHGEQRQYRERQTGTDVDLGGLGGPRQDERRPDDRDAVDERGEWRCEFGVRESEVGGGTEIRARQGSRAARSGAAAGSAGTCPGPGWSPGRIPPALAEETDTPVRSRRSGSSRHVVDQPVLPGLLGGEPAVAVGVGGRPSPPAARCAGRSAPRSRASSRRTCSARMVMSARCRRVPPEGWCMRIRACGSAYRLPGAPAESRNWPIEAASPTAEVATSGWTSCMVS